MKKQFPRSLTVSLGVIFGLLLFLSRARLFIPISGITPLLPDVPVAVFALDGNEYIFCLDAVNYDGKWYISDLGGSIGKLFMSSEAYLAGTIPVTVGERDEIHKLIVPVE